MAKDEGGWFDSSSDFLKSFDTGGDNHKTWEKAEDLFRFGKNVYMKKEQENEVEKGEDLGRVRTDATPISNNLNLLKDPKNIMFIFIGFIGLIALFRR